MPWFVGKVDTEQILIMAEIQVVQGLVVVIDEGVEAKADPKRADLAVVVCLRAEVVITEAV